jgi:hypothetical protein
MMTMSDFNLFVGGLLKELRLRQKIESLQEARRMGVTKMSEFAVYEKDKANRVWICLWKLQVEHTNFSLSKIIAGE